MNRGELLLLSAPFVTTWLVTVYSLLGEEEAVAGGTGEEACEVRGRGTGGVMERERGVGGVCNGVGVLLLGESLITEYNSSPASSTVFSGTEHSPNTSEYSSTLGPPSPPLEPSPSRGIGGSGIFPRPFTAADDFLLSGMGGRGFVGGGGGAAPPLATGTRGDTTPF